MGEAVQKVATYLQLYPILTVGMAFVAGFAAVKTVAHDRRSSWWFYLLVGVVGLFLGEFILFYYALDEYLENISQFRIFFDFIAAYVGSFIAAAIIHFVKPT